jgi:aminoglycoside 3-N-acetyltransferase
LSRFHYNKQDIINSLKACGIKKGDLLFSHVSLHSLGLCQTRTPVETLIEAIKDVIGEEGTFITPAFSYSFCSEEVYNPKTSVSTVGAFSNHLIKQLNMSRSVDPIFSVVGFGAKIDSLFHELPPTSFGNDCLFERLLNSKAKILNIGLTLFYLTPIHYLERTLNVPYRFDKNFSGIIEIDQQRSKLDWEYYVRDLSPESIPNCTPLQLEGFKAGICHKETLGLSEIYVVSMQEYFQLASTLIQKNPWYLATGSVDAI